MQFAFFGKAPLKFGLEFFHYGFHRAFRNIGDSNVHEPVNGVVEQRINIEGNYLCVLLNVLLDQHRKPERAGFQFVDDFVKAVQV